MPMTFIILRRKWSIRREAEGDGRAAAGKCAALTAQLRKQDGLVSPGQQQSYEPAVWRHG